MTKMAGFYLGVGLIPSLKARRRHWPGPEALPSWNSSGEQRKRCGTDSAGCSLE